MNKFANTFHNNLKLTFYEVFLYIYSEGQYGELRLLNGDALSCPTVHLMSVARKSLYRSNSPNMSVAPAYYLFLFWQVWVICTLISITNFVCMSSLCIRHPSVMFSNECFNKVSKIFSIPNFMDILFMS